MSSNFYKTLNLIKERSKNTVEQGIAFEKLSKVYFENDEIIVDEISPKDRFGILFKNDTKWSSMSMGKSLVSYVTGHAICGGYIDSIDTTLNDWPLIKNTLYSKKKLIDILNMAAGDQQYVDDNDGLNQNFKLVDWNKILK